MLFMMEMKTCYQKLEMQREPFMVFWGGATLSGFLESFTLRKAASFNSSLQN